MNGSSNALNFTAPINIQDERPNSNERDFEWEDKTHKNSEITNL